MEQVFKLFVDGMVIGISLCVILIMAGAIYQRRHPIESAPNPLAGKALSRKTKLRIRLSASEVLRRSVSSKTNMTAAGRALCQRMKL